MAMSRKIRECSAIEVLLDGWTNWKSSTNLRVYVSGASKMAELQGSATSKRTASARGELHTSGISFRILTYGKTHFSGRGGKRHGFQVSGRSGWQTAARGLRNFSRFAGVAGPQLQAIARRPKDDRLSRSHSRDPGPIWIAAGAVEVGLLRAELCI